MPHRPPAQQKERIILTAMLRVQTAKNTFCTARATTVSQAWKK